MIGKKNTARANSQSTSFIYYECGKYLNSDRRNCKSHYVKGETVAKKITEELLAFAEIIQSKEFAKNIITPLKYDLVMIRKQVLDTREKKEKVSDNKLHNYENYIDGIITREEFQERAIPLREKESELKEQEHELRKQMDAMDEKMDSIVALKQLLRDFSKTKDLSKEVVEALVKRIVVGVEHTFTVEYKFDFGE